MQGRYSDGLTTGNLATCILKALHIFCFSYSFLVSDSSWKLATTVKMVNESLPSPGYRRNSLPLSPAAFRRSLSSPDISWRSLAHRHKFLLYALGLLTLLCTVYLYFAIAWGATDLCSGLGGAQRALCQRENNLKADTLKAHHRRLLFVEDSDSPSKKVPSGGRLKEFEAFFSSDSEEDQNEIEITRLKGTIIGLRKSIRALRRVNTRLRKTVTSLRQEHHTPSEDNHAPLTAIPVPPKVPRLRGNI